MDTGSLAQHVFNGLMLGIIYAMVAVGFSLFFGVLDVVKFSHGDIVTVGAFAALGFTGLAGTFLTTSPTIVLLVGLFGAVTVGGLSGALIGRVIALPLRRAQPVNVLLATLMAGTSLREALRLGIPNGGNPKPFPTLLPTDQISLGSFSVGIDSIVIFACGLLLIAGTYGVIKRTNLGLSIRAVAQDEEAAKLAGINFERTVIVTFLLGSGLAAVAGMLIALYYREITFNSGVLLGVIGFTAAVVGGLGSILGAVLGGFLFAAIQTMASISLPFSGAYKDVVAFGVMVVLMSVFPTGLIAEKASERV